MAEKQGSSEQEYKYQVVAFWAAVASVALVGAMGAVLLYFILFNLNESPLAEVILDHFLATFGLPAAAGGAFVLVVFLRQTQGPIEFEGLGFKFRGASGPVVMWVFCFLALVVGLRTLW